MQYLAPAITSELVASVQIQGIVKSNEMNLDNNTHAFNATPAAYEADE